MKSLIIFIVLLGLVACSREVPSKEPIAKQECKTVVEANSVGQEKTAAPNNVKIIDWGPQSTTVGVNPNVQPGGELGIWIRLSSTKELGEVQLMFNGQPALVTTVVDDGLITAAVAADQLHAIGKKELTLLQTQTKKNVQIGVFTVLSN